MDSLILKQEFQDILSASEDDDDCTLTDDVIQQDDDVLNSIGDSVNPFDSWMNVIHTDSIIYKKEGNDLNPLYLPSVIPLIKK